MKKFFSVVALSALLATGLATAGGAAYAEADPATLTLTCTTNETLVSSLSDEFPSGAPYVISALIGDDIAITASGTSPASDCDIANVSGNAALTSGGTVEGGTSTAANELDVANSGAFTITPVTGAAITVYVDACSLSGSGIESDPWRVATQADFQKVGLESSTSGQQSCSLVGHYLQTAALILDDYSNDVVGSVDDQFGGTYDGDHYQISLSGTWKSGDNESGVGYGNVIGLFSYVTGATIKKIFLTGEIRSSAEVVGPLVGYMDSGIISEVESRVNVEVSANSVVAGGIVGRLGENEGDARVQYSKYQSTSGIQHFTSNTSATNVVDLNLGGIAGEVAANVEPGGGIVEVRDSYVQASFSFNSDYNDQTATPEIAVGGLIGDEDYEDDPATRLIRNYVVATVTDSCSTACDSASRTVGGLIGEAHDDVYVAPPMALVSNFFVTSGLVSQAIGGFHDSSTDQPEDYTDQDGVYAPVAVPVSTTELRTLNTFTTQEDQTSLGNPGGVEIEAGTSNLADFRWAITSERSTFVPSTYTTTADDDPGSVADQLDYANRDLYDPETDGAKEYLRLRAGVLSAYGGQDPRSTTTYTTLGNVWEICPGEDYPTLVWEEETCGGGGSGSRDNDDDSSTAAAAAALGLTEAEYAAFLASGLTLEQFRAMRLAATGVPSGVAPLGLGLALTLLVVGAGALVGHRRWATKA